MDTLVTTRLKAAATPAAEALRADVAIIGGGFAGSLAALKLGHAGLKPIVIDLHHPYPADFRCEKFSPDQIRGLQGLGVLDAFRDNRLYGPDPSALTRRGLRYDQMVNALRRQWPADVGFVKARASRLIASPGRQQITLSTGEVVDCRLVVLATGPGDKLRAELGLKRDMLSEAHSVCIGFSLSGAFGFDSLIHRSETLGDGVGYASLFRIGAGDNALMRVNLFLYDDPKSERVKAFRLSPLAELFRIMPGLRAKLMLAQVSGPVELRVTDLYSVTADNLPGVVLIGDARRTSCPASGTGISRILSDVRLLSETFVPAWLKDDGMAASKIAAFYASETLRAEDDDHHRRSLGGRQLATEIGWRLRLRRVLHRGRAMVTPFLPRPRLQALAPHYLTGDEVTVASAQEILATLDRYGRLDGLPFLPEMVPFIGQTLRVHHRADRTCVEGHGIRRMDDTIFLEEARCDGSSHDGCQRACLTFWKSAWLRPLGTLAKRNDVAEQQARLKLLNLPVHDARGYVCQSTELRAATDHLPRVHLTALLSELIRREMTAVRFVQIVARGAINAIRRLLKKPDLGQIVGEAGKKSKGDLGLQPGDWVKVRSLDDIRATLGPNAKNLGLSFEPEMAMASGQIRQVEAIVERMVHEETGQMINLTRTVTLKSTYCQGLCAKACSRANPLFWREAWLERVEPPQT